MTVISDLEEALITLSLKASDRLLKMWLDLMTNLIKSELIETLVLSMKYRIPIIFK